MAIHIVEHEILPALMEAIRAADEREIEGLRKGMTPDRYREAIGYLRALDWVRETVTDLVKRKEEP